MAVLPVTPAHAVTFVPCGNVAALRAAINASNTSNENIALAPNCTYTIRDTVNTTNGGNGLPSVTGSYSISGSDTTVRRSTEAGIPNFRIFNVVSGGDLTLNSIHVLHGRVPTGAGGGIRVSGAGSSVTVFGGSVRDNSAQTGGGIRIGLGASATLNSSMVSGNDASGRGGGISHAGSTLRLDFSAVRNNRSGLEGGGIYEGPGSQVSLASSAVFFNIPNNCRPVGAVPGCPN